jgi:hypothetical protein
LISPNNEKKKKKKNLSSSYEFIPAAEEGSRKMRCMARFWLLAGPMLKIYISEKRLLVFTNHTKQLSQANS